MATQPRNVRNALGNGPTATNRGPILTSGRQLVNNGPRAARPRRASNAVRLRQTLALPPAQRMYRQMRRLAGMSGG